MSTFFEKLTGAVSTRPQVVTPPTPNMLQPKPNSEPKKSAPPPNQTKQEKHTLQLKIEAENTATKERGDVTEEEGELTLDIYDKGDSIVIQSTVAGVKPEDLDISITNDSVSIRGKRERMEEVEEKNYYYKELFWGTFSRSIILPEEIEEDLAEATIKHGLLTIRLPKKKRGIVQKLKVKVT